MIGMVRSIPAYRLRVCEYKSTSMAATVGAATTVKGVAHREQRCLWETKISPGPRTSKAWLALTIRGLLRYDRNDQSKVVMGLIPRPVRDPVTAASVALLGEILAMGSIVLVPEDVQLLQEAHAPGNPVEVTEERADRVRQNKVHSVPNEGDQEEACIRKRSAQSPILRSRWRDERNREMRHPFATGLVS